MDIELLEVLPEHFAKRRIRQLRIELGKLNNEMNTEYEEWLAQGKEGVRKAAEKYFPGRPLEEIQDELRRKLGNISPDFFGGRALGVEVTPIYRRYAPRLATLINRIDKIENMLQRKRKRELGIPDDI